VKHDWELARDVGARSASTSGWGRSRPVLDGEAAGRDGLLGPDTTYIHCNYLSDEEFRLIADSGGKISIAPTVEMYMGHGTPPTAKALATGCARA
jgi:cytosine/adenosine deaminase-related metal-dependent hydrolase